MEAPAYDCKAEQAVLGCMLFEAKSIEIALADLTANDFYSEHHQNIFSHIKNIYERGEAADIISVPREARENGGIERCGDSLYISDLLNSVPTTANLPYYIKIVKKDASKRNENEIRQQLVNDIESGCPLDEVLTIVDKAKDSLREKEKPLIWEISKFLNHDFQEPPAYCKGLVYSRGILGVFGQPKSYKTFFVLNMAFALAVGKPFLNFEIARPIKTLILQAELSDGRLQERMKKLIHYWGIPQDDKLFVRTIRGAFINEAKGLAEVSAIIREIDPEVIIIDPLVEFFAGDENNAQEVNNLFANLGSLMADHRSIILVHHLRKPNNKGGDSFAQIRGSSVIHGKLDAGINITTLVDGQVALDFTCRNILKPDKFIATVDENLIFRYYKEFGSAKVKDSHIIDILKDKGETLIQDLADEVSETCECTPETAGRHITRMIKTKTLIKIGGTRNARVKLPE